MVKCPFCAFENEDGALFCEQCKSDLSSVAPEPAPVVAEAIAIEAVAIEETPEAAVEVVEAVAVEAVAIVDEAPMAVAEAVELAPVAEAAPIEEAAPVVEAAPIPEPTPPPPAPVVEAAPPPPPPPAPAPVAAAPVAPPPPPAPAPAPVAAAPAPAAAAPAGKGGLPPGSSPKLIVIRGQRVKAEYPIYADLNFIGRADDKPVDIDLEDQEPPDRVWCSRQHAVLNWDESSGTLTLEDLNSSNGTYVNRARVYPGEKRSLIVNDVIQIGNVQMKVTV